MSKKVSYELSAQDKTATGINSAVNNLRRLDGDVKNITKTFDILKNSIIVGMGVQAVKAIGNFVGSCVTEFADFERSNLKLRAALGGNEAIIERMGELVSELGSKSNSTNDDLEALIAELAQLGKSPAEIEKLTRASVILAEVTGKNLQGAFTQLQGTLSGTAGELEKLIPELGNLTKEQLESGDAVQYVIDKMGAFAGSVETSYAVKIKNLGEAFNDLKQTLGEGWAEAFKPMIDEATTAVNKIIDEIERGKKAQKAVKNIYGIAGAVSGGNKDEAVKIAKTMPLTELQEGYDLAKASNPLATAKQQAALDAILAVLTTRNVEARFKVDTTPSTTTPVSKGGSSDALDKAEAEFQKFVDANRVGWREIDSGIDDVIAELLNPTVPGSAIDISAGEGANTASGLSMVGADTGIASFIGPIEQFSSLIGSIAGPFAQLAEPLSMINQLLNPLQLILSGFLDVIGPAITTVIQPLFDAFKMIGTMLGQVLLPIFDSLAPIFAILAQMLMTLVLPIIQLLMPSIQMISGILDVVLTPILKAVAIAFEILMSPIKWLGDLFSWVANAIKVAVHNLVEYIEHPINANNRDIQSIGAFSSDAFSGLGNRIADIWQANYKTDMATTNPVGTVATGTSGGVGASYTAAKDIIVNVSIDRSAIADLRDIALIIRNEIKSAEALGY